MELEADLDETFRSRYAQTTLKTQDVGVKHWIIFTMKVLAQGSVYLFTLADMPPSQSKIGEAETRLLWFAAYLARSYPPGTIAEYISHVKGRHYFWLHFHDFAEYGIVFHRVAVFLRIKRKLHPRIMRQKVPFTKHLMERMWLVLKNDFNSGKFGAMVCWCVQTMAFQQLMRLNELVTMSVASQANEHPIMISHCSFYSKVALVVQPPTSAKDAQLRWTQVAYAVVLAPPTKADPTAANDPYYLPVASGKSRVLAPCWALWCFLGAHPVPLVARHSTPLFRIAPAAFSPQIKDYGFSVSFKAACRAANIRYSVFGKHRYRVGGLNALQDAGCSVTQIMAAGHWKSDAWKVYSRRQRTKLMHYSNLMLR